MLHLETKQPQNVFTAIWE